MKKTLFLLLCLSVSNTFVFSQIAQPHRFEKKHKSSEDDYSVISLRDQGIALIRSTNKYKDGNRTWEFIHLDTALREVKTQEYSINNRYLLTGYEESRGFVYFLFNEPNTKGNSNLMKISLANYEMTEYKIEPELNIRVTHFIHCGGNFIFGGYVANDPALLHYNISDKSLKIIPGFFQKETELIDLQSNVNNTFNVLLIDRSQKDDRKLIIKTFDNQGKELLADEISIEADRTILSGATSTLVRDELMISGTWGQRLAKQSSGFYFTSVNPFQDQSLKYVQFGELSHYLDFLKPKSAAHIKEKTKRAIEQKKIADYANYVNSYRIIEHPEGFLVLAEVYNPSSSFNQGFNNTGPYPYNNPSYPYYNPYWGYYPRGRVYTPTPYGTNVRNEQEIKTQETVLVAFDQDGNIKWDHSMKLEDIKTQEVDQISDVCVVKGSVYFIYKKESELKAKVIDLANEEVKDVTEKIKTTDPFDEIRSEHSNTGNVRYWYQNHFFTWGYQTIRNINKDDRVQDVFYINKITAQ